MPHFTVQFVIAVSLLYNESRSTVTGDNNMKRYMRGIVAAVISVSFIGGTVGAEEACPGATITNTGPDSVNEITCVDSTAVQVTCTNNVYVVNNNSQTGGTGSGVITGNATNTNGTTVQIGAACTSPTATTTVTPPPAAVKPSTGMGATSLPEPKATVLPNTASNPVTDIAIASTLGLAGIMAVSRIGIAAYRRIALR